MEGSGRCLFLDALSISAHSIWSHIKGLSEWPDFKHGTEHKNYRIKNKNDPTIWLLTTHNSNKLYVKPLRKSSLQVPLYYFNLECSWETSKFSKLPERFDIHLCYVEIAYFVPKYNNSLWKECHGVNVAHFLVLKLVLGDQLTFISSSKLNNILLRAVTEEATSNFTCRRTYIQIIRNIL